MSKELIRLRDLCMAFDDEPVLNHINLYINDKEFLTLLGPSGCGKTTTLRIIGGFATPTSGDVLFDGVRINDVPPYQRQINTVFQKYALFPNLNVYENIAFGLRMQRRPDPNAPSRPIPIYRLADQFHFSRRKGFKILAAAKTLNPTVYARLDALRKQRLRKTGAWQVRG